MYFYFRLLENFSLYFDITQIYDYNLIYEEFPGKYIKKLISNIDTY